MSVHFLILLKAFPSKSNKEENTSFSHYLIPLSIDIKTKYKFRNSQAIWKILESVYQETKAHFIFEQHIVETLFTFYFAS